MEDFTYKFLQVKVHFFGDASQILSNRQHVGRFAHYAQYFFSLWDPQIFVSWLVRPFGRFLSFWDGPHAIKSDNVIDAVQTKVFGCSQQAFLLQKINNNNNK